MSDADGKVDLAALGFNPSHTARVWKPGDCMVCSIWGPFMSGKTYFALSAPTPLCLYDFEMQASETLASFPDKADQIVHRQYLVPRTQDTSLAMDNAERFLREFHEDLQKLARYKKQTGKTPTMVIDSATQCWDLLRFAFCPPDPRTGRSPNPRSYARPNNEYHALLMEPKSMGVNVVVTVRSKPEWTDAGGSWRRTGDQEADCKDETFFLSSVVLEVQKRRSGEKTTRKYLVRDCRANRDIEGAVFTDEDGFDFRMLAKVIAEG